MLGWWILVVSIALVTAPLRDQDRRGGGSTSSGVVSVLVEQRTQPQDLIASGCEPQWAPTFGGLLDISGAATTWQEVAFEEAAELYVGGSFQAAGSVPARNVARWTGSTWTDVGGGVTFVGQSSPAFARVDRLTRWQSSTGLQLLAAGAFDTAGDVACANIAAWTGTHWLPLGSGTNGRVRCLAVSAGASPVVVVGGDFSSAGGVAAQRVARWNGATWSALGAGLSGSVQSIIVATQAGSETIFAAGFFPGNVARWTGSAWVTANAGLPSSVNAFVEWDAGSGRQLYAAVIGSHLVWRWNGVAWESIGAGVPGEASGFPTALDVVEIEGESRLVVSGQLERADGSPLGAVTWNGSAWSPIPSADTLGTAYGVRTGAIGGATEPTLYALGTGIAGAPLGSIGQLVDGQWVPLQDGSKGRVYVLHPWQGTLSGQGTGNLLIAGGILDVLGGTPVAGVAAWDGQRWQQVGDIQTGWIYALATYDDGSGEGPELYAGGQFTFDGFEWFNLAKWNGSRWQVFTNVNETVFTLMPFDAGTGESLYVGGVFTDVGIPGTQAIARYDGAWHSVGGGSTRSSGIVRAMAVGSAGEGKGNALFVGGDFEVMAAEPTFGVARWDGRRWSHLYLDPASAPTDAIAMTAVPGGIAFCSRLRRDEGVTGYVVSLYQDDQLVPAIGGEEITAATLLSYDDGRGDGAALFAGSGEPLSDAAALRRWNGTTWESVVGSPDESIYALTTWTATPAADGEGLVSLIVGGTFLVTPQGDALLAKLDPCQANCVGDIDGDGAIGPNDIALLLGSWNESNSPADVDGDGIVSSGDLATLLGSWGPCP